MLKFQQTQQWSTAQLSSLSDLNRCSRHQREKSHYCLIVSRRIPWVPALTYHWSFHIPPCETFISLLLHLILPSALHLCLSRSQRSVSLFFMAHWLLRSNWSRCPPVWDLENLWGHSSSLTLLLQTSVWRRYSLANSVCSGEQPDACISAFRKPEFIHGPVCIPNLGDDLWRRRPKEGLWTREQSCMDSMRSPNNVPT